MATQVTTSVTPTFEPLTASNYPPGTIAIDNTPGLGPYMVLDGVNWSDLSLRSPPAPVANLYLIPVGQSVTLKNIGNP